MAELATVARPYAEALFRVAQAGKESTGLAVWSELVSELAQIGEHPEVQAFARNPKASDSEVSATLLSLVKSPLNQEDERIRATALGSLLGTAELRERRSAAIGSATRSQRAGGTPANPTPEKPHPR